MKQVPFSAKFRQNSLVLLIRRLWTLTTVLGYIHAAEYLNSRRATYPGMLFRAGTIAAGIVMAALAMHMVSTGFGRIVEDVILQAGTAIGLIALFVVIGIMFHGTVLSFRHVRQTWAEDRAEAGPKLLTAPTWTPPDISPDILVCAFDEKAAFEMAEKAEKATTHAIWAVVIPPKKKQAAILTAGMETDYFFERGSEPFADTIPAGFGLPAGLDHTAEDERQYQKYVDWFCQFYLKWRDAAKLEADKGRAKQTLFEVMEAHAKAVSAVLFFLLFCLPSFGQSKTRQVDEALGTRIREIPEAGAKVIFAFQEGGKEKYYTRTGDGRSDYTALLQTTSGLIRFDDRGGELIAIQKNGEIVARAENVERVNLSPVEPNGAPYMQENTTGDPIRPRGVLTAPDVENTPVTGEPMRFSIPDSSTTAATMEDAKRVITGWKGKFWEQISPIWEFVMWAFSSFIILLVCLIGLFRYIAKTAANESLISIYGRVIVGGWIVRAQQNAAATTLLLTWVIAIIVLVDIFLWLVWLDLPVWSLLLIWLPILWVAEKITDKIVPNLKVVGSNGRDVTPY